SSARSISTSLTTSRLRFAATYGPNGTRRAVSRTTAWKWFKAVLGLEGIVSKKLNAPYKSGPSKAWLKIKNPKAPASTRSRWDVLMNRKFIAVILLAVAVPVYAHAQNPRVSKGDAEKVATIISGDKAKTQTYCDMQKLAEQIQKANENKDSKMVDELFQKL